MKSQNGLALAFGISGIVISILGGITFGIIGAILGLGLSVSGIMFGVNTKKATGNTQGTGGLVCGIIGAVFGAIFFIGCIACGGSYGKWGCIGGCNSAVKDAKDDPDLQDAWNELEKAFQDAAKNAD